MSRIEVLFQNDACRNLFKIRKKIPNATLLLGPKGVGKRKATLWLFQWVNCQKIHTEEGLNTDTEIEACGACTSCLMAFKGSHPDFNQVEVTESQISIETIRELKKNIQTRPLMAHKRFVVVNDAHKLNASSSNALLKILEEPPEHTKFFLCTHERSLLLPTILSRCQFIRFSPLTSLQLKELIQKLELGISDKAFSHIQKLGIDGLEHLSKISSDSSIQFLEELSALNVHHFKSWSNICETAESLNKSADEDAWKLELFISKAMADLHSRIISSTDNSTRLDLISAHQMFLKLESYLQKNGNHKLVALAASNEFSRQLNSEPT